MWKLHLYFSVQNNDVSKQFLLLRETLQVVGMGRIFST